MSVGYVLKEVWRGRGGVMDRCQLQCTCGWASDEFVDAGEIRSLRVSHAEAHEAAHAASRAVASRVDFPEDERTVVRSVPPGWVEELETAAADAR